MPPERTVKKEKVFTDLLDSSSRTGGSLTTRNTNRNVPSVSPGNGTNKVDDSEANKTAALAAKGNPLLDLKNTIGKARANFNAAISAIIKIDEEEDTPSDAVYPVNLLGTPSPVPRSPSTAILYKYVKPVEFLAQPVSTPSKANKQNPSKRMSKFCGNPGVPLTTNAEFMEFACHALHTHFGRSGAMLNIYNNRPANKSKYLIQRAPISGEAITLAEELSISCMQTVFIFAEEGAVCVGCVDAPGKLMESFRGLLRTGHVIKGRVLDIDNQKSIGGTHMFYAFDYSTGHCDLKFMFEKGNRYINNRLKEVYDLEDVENQIIDN